MIHKTHFAAIIAPALASITAKTTDDEIATLAKSLPHAAVTWSPGQSLWSVESALYRDRDTKRELIKATVISVAELDSCWGYGGYPLAFWPVTERGRECPGVLLCRDCVRSDLEMMAEPDGDIGSDTIGFDCTVEDGDSKYCGGVTCECGEFIVEPCCPECGDKLAEKSALLFSDTREETPICFDCAVAMVKRSLYASMPNARPSDVYGTMAHRIMGGIRIVDSPATVTATSHAYGWQESRQSLAYGTPWYARAGTVYRYAWSHNAEMHARHPLTTHGQR